MTGAVRVAIVAPRRTLADRLRGDRCPYCGQRDRRPTTHISAGRCYGHGPGEDCGDPRPDVTAAHRARAIARFSAGRCSAERTENR